MVLNELALCSGIGGISLGLERAGLARAVCHVEIDPYAAGVLISQMEQGRLAPAPIWDDLATFRAEHWRGCVDLVTAGYPCQPFSVAGKQRGEDDPRHLWPEVARIIRQVEPRFVLLENVPGHIGLGFDAVLGDLAESGFDARWFTLQAAEVGAPHRRERLFCWAWRHSDTAGRRLEGGRYGNGLYGQKGENRAGQPAGMDSRASRQDVADAERDGLKRIRSNVRSRTLEESAGQTCSKGDESTVPLKGGCQDVADAEKRTVRTGLCSGEPAPEWRRRPRNEHSQGHTWTTEPDVGRVAHGVPSRVDRLRCLAGPEGGDEPANGSGSEDVPHPNQQAEPALPIHAIKGKRLSEPSGHWDVEPNVGRVVNGVPSRVDRLRCLGNAVVPQVAERIGYAIKDWLT